MEEYIEKLPLLIKKDNPPLSPLSKNTISSHKTTLVNLKGFSRV